MWNRLESLVLTQVFYDIKEDSFNKLDKKFKIDEHIIKVPGSQPQPLDNQITIHKLCPPAIASGFFFKIMIAILAKF